LKGKAVIALRSKKFIASDPGGRIQGQQSDKQKN
jgi:hypothetical protein